MSEDRPAPPAGRPLRRRPLKPFSARCSIKRALWKANAARLPDGRRLPRSCVAMLVALAYRQGYVKSGVVFIGNFKLGELAGVSARTVTDSKYLLELAGLLYIANTAANGKVAGGKTHDEHGRLVACATGYQLHPLLEKPEKKPQAAAAPPRKAELARELVAGLARRFEDRAPPRA